MNYDKRKSEVCRECPIKDNCLYITRGLSDKCERNQLIMEGWEKGWEDAFEETVGKHSASDRGMVEEIIINLKRVEQDYNIDLTKEMEWLRNIVKKGE